MKRMSNVNNDDKNREVDDKHLTSLKEITNNEQKYKKIALKLNIKDIETKYFHWNAESEGTSCSYIELIKFTDKHKNLFKELYVRGLIEIEGEQEEWKKDYLNISKKERESFFLKRKENNEGYNVFNEWSHPVLKIVPAEEIEEKLYNSVFSLILHQSDKYYKEVCDQENLNKKEYVNIKLDKKEVLAVKKDEFYTILNYIKDGKNIFVGHESLDETFYISIKKNSILLIFFEIYF